MPWNSYDPTLKMKVYNNLPVDGEVIPTTDEVAYSLFRNKPHKWVYNKLLINEFQGIPYGICGTEPTEYPVIIKPIFNLEGGGTGAIVAHNIEEYNKYKKPGYFWSRFQMGEHYSVDLILVDGSIKELICFRAEKLQLGLFDYWERYLLPNNLVSYVTDFIGKYLINYSGCINLEIIGEAITEIHLRMGDIDRLADLSLLKAIYNVYNNNYYNYQLPFYPFYIAALFAQPNTTFSINEKLLNLMCKELTYFQLDTDFSNNPPSGNRLAIFCGTSLEAVCDARNAAIALFNKEIHGKYLQPLTLYKDYR